MVKKLRFKAQIARYSEPNAKGYTDSRRFKRRKKSTFGHEMRVHEKTNTSYIIEESGNERCAGNHTESNSPENLAKCERWPRSRSTESVTTLESTVATDNATWSTDHWTPSKPEEYHSNTYYTYNSFTLSSPQLWAISCERCNKLSANIATRI